MKSKAERDYIAALKRLNPMLTELSHAAHKMTAEQSDEDAGIDRMFALGEIVSNLAGACPASARIIADLSLELLKDVHHRNRDHDDAVVTPTSPGSRTEH
jgi:hypothetical protein